MTIGRRGLKVEGPLSKVDTQMCVLVLHEYLQRMMAVVVGFHFDHLRASVAKASISGGVQREWVW